MNNEDPEGDILAGELATCVMALGETETLMIADLRDDGIVIWNVRRDGPGTAQGWNWPAVPWESMFEDGQLMEEKLDRVAFESVNAMS